MAHEAYTVGQIVLSPNAKKVIELAVAEARELNHEYVGTQHFLLGLVHDVYCLLTLC